MNPERRIDSITITTADGRFLELPQPTKLEWIEDLPAPTVDVIPKKPKLRLTFKAKGIFKDEDS